MQITLLNTLESQRGNQGGTDTASVLGSQDLDGVLLVGIRLLGPVQDLAQGRRATSLEVGVLVEYGAVGTDMARAVALLLADGGDAAGRETGGASTDQLGGAADQLELLVVGGDLELGLEQLVGLGQVLEGVTAGVLASSP